LPSAGPNDIGWIIAVTAYGKLVVSLHALMELRSIKTGETATREASQQVHPKGRVLSEKRSTAWL